MHWLCIHFSLFYHCLFICLFVCLFDGVQRHNISVISWRSVLLVEETGRTGENHWPVTSHWQTLLHNVVHLTLIEIRTHNISGDRYWLHRQLYVSFSLFMPMIFILFFFNVFDLFWKLICKICSQHDIAEILLKLALNTNEPINQTIN
jgi:hypothetical protein